MLQERFDEAELFLFNRVLGRLLEFGEVREDLVEHRVVQQFRFEFLFRVRFFGESSTETACSSQHPKIKCGEVDSLD